MFRILKLNAVFSLIVLAGLLVGCSTEVANINAPVAPEEAAVEPKLKDTSSFKPDQAIVSIANATTTTITFTIEGMMCAEACAPAVAKILEAQPGVVEVAVDFETKIATCKIDEKDFDSAAVIADLADKDFIATLK